MEQGGAVVPSDAQVVGGHPSLQAGGLWQAIEIGQEALASAYLEFKN
ncbi:hypothetical protein [Salinicola tamaricis]|nr:hypothetical protein [Salinicola tamaricis]